MFLQVVLEDVLCVLGEVYQEKGLRITVLKDTSQQGTKKMFFQKLFLLVEHEFSKLPSLAYFSYLNGT